MTPDQDRNETIRRRKAQREQRRMENEKRRKKVRLQLLAVAVVIAAAVGLVAAFALRQDGPAPSEPVQTTVPTEVPPTTLALAGETQPPTRPSVPGLTETGPLEYETTAPSTEATEPPETAPTELPEYTVIHISAAGDLNVTPDVVKNAQSPDGYNFQEVFHDVAPLLSGADLTLLNLEGTLAGPPYGTEQSSAPIELARELKAIGVDAVQTANSASIRAGILGLQSTITNLYTAGLLPVGTFYNSRMFDDCGGYTMVEIQDMRIALVAFTKGMDNLGLPEGSEDCVNVLYEDYTTTYKKVDESGIRRVLHNVAEEQPDLTIAMLHWGSEYNEGISDTQKKIRDLMLDNGVDVILGTHPHLVQTIDFDPQAGTLVAYSLGDFYGDADQPGSNYSLVLDMEVTRDNLTGEVKVTGFDYTPIFTVRPEDSAMGGQRVVQLRNAISRYETGFIGKVTPEVYESMKHALQRVDERVQQEIE